MTTQATPEIKVWRSSSRRFGAGAVLSTKENRLGRGVTEVISEVIFAGASKSPKAESDKDSGAGFGLIGEEVWVCGAGSGYWKEESDERDRRDPRFQWS
ncbi:hypothetical protein U1Q18_002847 [Sarracenia purpurea var. burkii]